MSSAIENITITLFGLEEDIWEATEESERRTYGLVTNCFLIFFFLAIFSSVFLVYLIIGSIFFAIPFGIIAALIIGSVVQFSLIIMRRSIFDVEEDLKQKKNLVETDQNENPSESFKDIIKKRFLSFVVKIKSIKINQIKSNQRVPGLATIIRIIIISMMGLLVLFPLTSLFHFSDVEKINEIKRNEYISQFQKDLQNSLQSRTAVIKRDIKSVEGDIEKNNLAFKTDGLVQEKKIALVRLKSQLDYEIKTFESQRAVQLERFISDINEKYFLTLTFKSIVKMPLFLFCALTILLLLLIPHFILFSLQKKGGDTYSKRSTDHYKTIIDVEYERAIKEGYDHLYREWGYKPQGYGIEQGVYWAQNQFWSNPPYNTVPHHAFSEKKQIDAKAFIKSFEIQTSVEVNK